MKEYKKPKAEIMKFNSTDDSMKLLSGNYNVDNIIGGSDGNEIRFELHS